MVWKLIFGTVILGAVLWRSSAAGWNALENSMPSHMLIPVSLGESTARERRQAVDKTQPLRILPFYDDSVDDNLQASKVNLVRDTIIPKLLDFLQQSLSVAPLPESTPILLNNMCTTSGFLRDGDGNIKCAALCAPTTMCGQFGVPQEHLKQCVQCNSNGQSVDLNDCVPGTPAEDGAGVSGYDFILYITADQSACPDSSGGAQTVAIASSCQTEAVQDRPVAGTINFCPEGVRDRDADFAFAVSKHEILHALGFSSFLFSLWRDENNMPRTERDVATGLPEVGNDGFFEISQSTVETVTYNDWVTASGTISHTVRRMVTPAVQREARDHFNCPTLAGVELEDQGGPGTAMQHWEKRVLGNEAMTGQVTFNPVFSRFTFAALEDSGWYRVNYSLADPLIWGKGAGCRFAEGSCREWLNTQSQANQPLTPFCETPESTSPLALSCTADREAVSRCNLVDFNSDLVADYRNFPNPRQGGRVTVADFCPFQDVISFAGNPPRGTACSVSANTPPNNFLLESYGAGSRCVLHGRPWTVNGQSVSFYGGGCYQFSCGDSHVNITIGEKVFTCAFSQSGQEMVVDVQVSGQSYEGSILCPPNLSICHDASSSVADGGLFNGGSPVDNTGSSSVRLHAVNFTLLLFSLITYVL